MRKLTVLLLLVGTILTLTSCASPANTPQKQTNTATTQGGRSPMILVFSKTAGYRHASITDGIAAIRQLAAEQHVATDFSEDATIFTTSNLARYKAIVFLSTSGDIFNAEQKAAFEGYIHAGGGFVGIHAASDTEHGWPWYGQLVGAFFKSHPQISQATIDVEDHNHSSTSMLPTKWTRIDEWYNFVSNPRPQVHILLALNEKTYHGGTMGSDHPIAWYHQFEGGRAWYTGLGHTSETFHEPLFRAHLWGGISYAAGLST